MLSMPRIVRPDPTRFRVRNLVPPLDRPLADPLSETKNWRNFCAAEAPSIKIENCCWTWFRTPAGAKACASQIEQLAFASGNGVCLSSAEEELHLS